MEKVIEIKNEYNSLDNLNAFLKTASDFECSKEYDSWDVRTDANGQMEQCLILKKSSMHAVKLYFTKENTLKVTHIIPSKLMNAYFGKNQKQRQSILEIVTGKIKETLLAAPQQKAFDELELVIKKAAV
jgi:hypothetical protein